MQIIMFTSNSCSACKVAKKELAAVGIKVEEVNIDTELGRDTAIRMGIKGGLPTFVRGEHIVQGWTGSVGSLLAKL